MERKMEAIKVKNIMNKEGRYPWIDVQNVMTSAQPKYDFTLDYRIGDNLSEAAIYMFKSDSEEVLATAYFPNRKKATDFFHDVVEKGAITEPQSFHDHRGCGNDYSLDLF